MDDEELPAARARADTVNPMLGSAKEGKKLTRKESARVKGLLHIKELDRRRQAVLTEGKNRSMVGSGLRITGTLLPDVIVHPVFWAAIAGWVGGILVGAEEDLSEDFVVDFDMLFGVGAFLAFFTIFHLCECYRRWQETFDHAMNAILSLKSATLVLAACVKDGNAKYATDIVRYLNSAHLLSYVGVSDEYTVALFREYNQEQNLLSHAEAQQVEALDPEHGSAATSRCLLWALQVLEHCRESEAIDAGQVQKIEAQILRFKSCLARLQDLNDQPIPLAYFNLLAILTFIYVPLSSFMLGFSFASDWYISLVGMLLGNLSLVGITKLACHNGDAQDAAMGEERTPRFDDAAYDATSGIAIGAITVAIGFAIDLARCQCAEGSE
eukprot:g1835.t1